MASDQPNSTAQLFRAPYRVVKHEHVDDKWARVEVRCLGYSTEGTHPVEWPFALMVPKVDLGKWPLGASVSLAVTS